MISLYDITKPIEENESDFMFEVERLISQIEIYDQVWFDYSYNDVRRGGEYHGKCI